MHRGKAHDMHKREGHGHGVHALTHAHTQTTGEHGIRNMTHGHTDMGNTQLELMIPMETKRLRATQCSMSSIHDYDAMQGNCGLAGRGGLRSAKESHTLAILR